MIKVKNDEVICCLYYLIENDFDQLNPEDYGPADIEDDEARVFHHQGQLLIRMDSLIY